ncbi:choline transporter-like protein 4 [Hemibagrus wyckioides]|uniref:choline transporter-like protein 4 n=1 Tax=Hemibagrus wyckioides TaxID=337641 RepID=UPI00266BE2B6|nr:choline transporter-like protein 4 [Hemibagrus wyckioides]
MSTKQVQGKCLPSFDPKDIPSDFSVPGLTLDEKTLKNIMDATSALRSGFNAKSMKVRIIEDLAFTWYWILIGLVITLVVSMVLILLMRFCVSVVVVVLLVGVLSVGAYGRFLIFLNTDSGILLMLIYSHAHESCMAFTSATRVIRQSSLPVYYKVALNSSNPECAVITGNQPCVPESFKASDYPNCPVRCVFAQYDEEGGFLQRYAKYFQIYNFLACFWCLHFIIALSQCTLARTFSTYYWSLSKPQTIRRSTLCRALFQTLRYHTGSLAFGAVFVNMFQGIRIVLQYLKNVTKGGQRCSWCCCPLIIILRSCFCALDTVIKYFNRNTYIMIAVYGDNFFISARNACMLWGRNKDRVLVVDRVTDLLLFFGRLLVVGAIGVLAFCFFSGEIRVSADIFQAELLNFCWLPILVLMVGSYFIALGCFSVYSMGVDTFTLCVMDDLERHDGTLQRPYMSRSMMEILQKQNEFDV